MVDSWNHLFNQDIGIRLAPNLIIGNVLDFDYVYSFQGKAGVVVLDGLAKKFVESIKPLNKFMGIKQLSKIAGIESSKTIELVNTFESMGILEFSKPYELCIHRLCKKTVKPKRFTVWLHITESCNLRCDYCYIPKQPAFLSLGLAKQIVVNAINSALVNGYNELAIKLAGGEPMLGWDMLRQLIPWTKEYAAKSGLVVKFPMITNGTLLNNELLDYLESGIITLSVSLDGIGELHDRQRPFVGKRGSFSTVEKNLRFLVNKKFHPYILTTVTARNISGLIQLGEYCFKNSLGFRFSLYKYVPEGSMDLIPTKEVLIDGLLKFYHWVGDNLPEESLYRCHRLADINLLSPRNKNCGMGTNSVAVSSGGQASICQYLMKGELGSIKEGGLIDIVKHQKLYDIDATKINNIPECRDCYWKGICVADCPLFSQRVYGELGHKSPYCEVYKAVLPTFLEVHAIQIIRNIHRKEVI